MHGPRIACLVCGMHRETQLIECPNCSAVDHEPVECRRECCRPGAEPREFPIRTEYLDRLTVFLRRLAERESDEAGFARELLVGLAMERRR